MSVDEIAAHNIEAQEQLFADIWANRTKSVEEIASRLGISEAETASAMSGKDRSDPHRTATLGSFSGPDC